MRVVTLDSPNWRPLSQRLLRAVPVDPSTLSELSDAPCKGMLPPFSQRWPALASVPWYPGWGDGATSNVGSGCATWDRIALMVGTSAAMRAVWQTRRIAIARQLWCYRVDAARVVMGGALSEGGNVIDWLRATLRLPEDPAALEQLMLDATPDQSGLTLLPFLAGERSPGWHGDARATFSGLNLHTSPAQIFVAGVGEILCQVVAVDDQHQRERARLVRVPDARVERQFLAIEAPVPLVELGVPAFRAFEDFGPVDGARY